MNEINIKPNKDLGQNFLQNEEIVQKIVKELEIEKDDFVIEIGAGTGVFTKYLVKFCDKYLKLYVYEVDDRLIYDLKNITKGCSNTHIQHKDFLSVNLDKLFEPYRKQAKNYKIFGSIPYNITSPIIHKILNAKYRPDLIILVIQKEVADKLIAKAPNGSYWSNIILGYDAQKLMKISRIEFCPIPKVDSAVVILRKNIDYTKLVEKIGFKNWSKFLHHVFKNPRKMIKKTIKIEYLDKANIEPTLRPQHLTIEQLIDLYKIMKW